MPDLNLREVILLAPIAVLMVVMGLAPQPFLQRSDPATAYLLETVEQKRMAALQEAGRLPQTAVRGAFDGPRPSAEAGQGRSSELSATDPSQPSLTTR